MAVNKRLAGWSLLGVAIAAFVGAIVGDVVWGSRGILLAAITVEALALVGLVLLLVWPSPDFETGDVNPQLVRCPRCSSVFDPPKRGEQIECPTCGLESKAPKRRPAAEATGTETAKDDVPS